MVSAGRQKTKSKGSATPPKSVRSSPAKKAARPTSKKSKPVPKQPVARPARAPVKPAPKAPSKSKEPEPPLKVPLPGGRRHVLSLSFVRDGDEFLARLETDSGHITEFKNRSLDQLLTLVAGELEDLIE